MTQTLSESLHLLAYLSMRVTLSPLSTVVGLNEKAQKNDSVYCAFDCSDEGAGLSRDDSSGLSQLLSISGGPLEDRWHQTSKV